MEHVMLHFLRAPTIEEAWDTHIAKLSDTFEAAIKASDSSYTSSASVAPIVTNKKARTNNATELKTDEVAFASKKCLVASVGMHKDLSSPCQVDQTPRVPGCLV